MIKKSSYKLLFVFLTVLLSVFSLILGLGFGSVSLSLKECVKGLVFGEGASGIIIRALRLPRVLGALLCGAALSVSGLLLQSATGNDLAAPNTVGINSGAGAAVMVALCFIPTAYALESLLAFFGALLAAFITLGLSLGKRGGLSRSSVVLAGVAVGAMFNAFISYLSVRFPDALISYNVFSVGGFSGLYMEDILLPSIIIIAMLVWSMLLTPSLNLLSLGDELAVSLGVRVTRLRFTAIAIAAALASASVSFAGLIGFVGLIVPHTASRIIGNDKRFLLPFCAFFGAAFVTLADLLGRILFAPSELPVGILLGALGAPFFLVILLLKARREKA